MFPDILRRRPFPEASPVRQDLGLRAEENVSSPLSQPATFKTSSFCLDGSCVAVAGDPDGGVLVTSTATPDAGVLSFTAEEWRAFVAGVRNGEFDLDAVTA